MHTPFEIHSFVVKENNAEVWHRGDHGPVGFWPGCAKKIAIDRARRAKFLCLKPVISGQKNRLKSHFRIAPKPGPKQKKGRAWSRANKFCPKPAKKPDQAELDWFDQVYFWPIYIIYGLSANITLMEVCMTIYIIIDKLLRCDI